jgi:hypothetical protein
MQPRLPVQSLFGPLFTILIVLSALSLTFAPSAADEGVAVSWPDGTVAPTPMPVSSGALTFEANRVSTQLRIIDVAQARIPATVINLRLDDFRPLKLEVVDLDGNLVKTLADGLWAQGNHQMAWYHENQDEEVLESGLYVVRLTPDFAATEGLAMSR